MDIVVILEISCLIETVNKVFMNYKARRQKSVSRDHLDNLILQLTFWWSLFI